MNRQNLNQARVLIFDEARVFLSIVNELLTSAGACVHTVQSPKNPLDEIKQFNPDCLITSLEMSTCNGLDICKMIRASAEYNLIPIIVLTTKEAYEELENILDSGANDYVIRGSIREVMPMKVRSMLRLRNLMKEREKVKQFEAIQSLIGTYNHEFNNALTILRGSLKQISHEDYKDILKPLMKIDEMSLRMLDVVEKISHLRETEFSGYTKVDKIIDINSMANSVNKK